MIPAPSPLAQAAIAFLGGAIYEAAAVAWVRYSEMRAPWRAAFFSCVVACALVTGIERAVADRLSAFAFIFGYGVGTFAAVRLRT